MNDPADRPIRYGELMGKVRDMSDRLVRLIPADSRVAVLDEHPYFEAIHVLSLISLQMTVVPLALKYGEARCRQIIEHTRPNVLLSNDRRCITPEIAEACEAAGTVIITDQTGRLELRDSEMERSRQRNDAPIPPSFIMYTSGSTGKPKGTVLTYRNVLANIADIRSYFEITPRDCVLINRSFSHASVMTGEFLYGLLCGARLYFYNEPFIPRRLLGVMERQQITVFCTTPTIFYQLALDRSGNRLPDLKKVALMGEFLHKQVALKIHERFPHVLFFMVYGQTEAAPRVTYLPPACFGVKEGCIGQPLPSIECRVIDENGENLGAGKTGELAIKGPNVFWGYWDAPELTSAKLRNGWLHTGDVVSLGADGLLYIAGRKDDMIIRAGMNIYPIEIENVLLEDERIREAVVFGKADLKYGQKIHVKVVPEAGVPLADADVIDICKSKCSPYQYPDAVEIVAEIPRNQAGKTMRRQLI